jgi:hypothetical protein
MKKTKKIFISRSSDYLGGGFGFTLRHLVIYPPNDILQVNFLSNNPRKKKQDLLSIDKNTLDLKNPKIE